MADLFEVHDKALAGVSRVLKEARERIAVLENDWKDTSAAAIQAARERDEWKAAAAAAAEPWRRLLWLRHGCPISALYGDDGELQCSACGLDFRRQPAAEIEAKWRSVNERAFAAAADGPHVCCSPACDLVCIPFATPGTPDHDPKCSCRGTDNPKEQSCKPQS